MSNVQWKTPDEGQRICPKHVELRIRINLEISVSVVFSVKKPFKGLANINRMVGNERNIGVVQFPE